MVAVPVGPSAVGRVTGFLEGLADTKASVLTVGIILLTVVMAFVSVVGMLEGLHRRIKELERKVSHDTGSGNGS